eukprot:Em0009g738a
MALATALIKHISGTRAVVVRSEPTTHLNPHWKMGTTASFCKYIPQLVVPNRCISTSLTGNCMVAKRVKSDFRTKRAQGTSRGIHTKPPLNCNLEFTWIQV